MTVWNRIASIYRSWLRRHTGAGLPRCPRCREELGAHNDHTPEECWQRCERCYAFDPLGACHLRAILTRPTDWCKNWKPTQMARRKRKKN